MIPRGMCFKYARVRGSAVVFLTPLPTPLRPYHFRSKLFYCAASSTRWNCLLPPQAKCATRKVDGGNYADFIASIPFIEFKRL
jgi:hypothetical protein